MHVYHQQRETKVLGLRSFLAIALVVWDWTAHLPALHTSCLVQYLLPSLAVEGKGP